MALQMETSWRDGAECRDTSDIIFFGPSRSNHDIRLYYEQLAKSICGRCSVRDECLDYALTFPTLTSEGIWGGLTEKERRRLLRRQHGNQRRDEGPVQ